MARKEIILYASCQLGMDSGTEYLMFVQSEIDRCLFEIADGEMSWMWTGQHPDDARLAVRISQIHRFGDTWRHLGWRDVSIKGLPPGRHSVPMGDDVTLTADVEVDGDWEDSDGTVYRHFWHLDPVSLTLSDPMVSELLSETDPAPC